MVNLCAAGCAADLDVTGKCTLQLKSMGMFRASVPLQDWQGSLIDDIERGSMCR